MMKDSIGSVCPFFNTSRMVMDYTSRYYLPLHDLFTALTKDNLQGITSYMEWKRKIVAKWPQVSFISAGVEADNPKMGDTVQLAARVRQQELEAGDIQVYAVLEYNARDQAFSKPVFLPLDFIRQENEETLWEKEYTITNSGKLRAGFMLLPKSSQIQQGFENHLATWY